MDGFGLRPLKRGILITALSAIPFTGLLADEMNDLRMLLDSGAYEEVVKRGESLLEENPKSPDAGRLNQIVGEAKYYTRGERGRSYDNFVEARKKGVADAALYLGRLAMADYDFPAAQKHYADFKTLKKKSGSSAGEVISVEESDLKEGSALFERVRDIIVIDGVKVDKNGFLRKLRLPLSAGRVVETNELPLHPEGMELGETAYISESGDFMMWSQMDEESGYMRIMEANRLTDGSLSEPVASSDILGRGGDAVNPFLTADGTTLYYACNGEGSMGGYDIFMATRDPQTGEYLQPINAGIPFNSYGDDYLLAIDEENGVGWWATDRHFLPGNQIMLYVFLLPEKRVNIDGTPEEKRERSKLEDFKITWTPLASEVSEEDEEDEESPDTLQDDMAAGPKATQEELEASYRAKAEEIRKIEPGQKPRRHECRIPLKGGKFIFSADDVNSEEQKAMVDNYIAQEKIYSANAAELSKLRREYAEKPTAPLGQRIRSLENIVQKENAGLQQLLSQLYRALGYK